MSYDVKCWDLAESFLRDVGEMMSTTNNVDELAQRIQDTIEDFIAEKRKPQ